MQTDLTFAITTTVAQSISMLACITLFSVYFRLKKKTQGLQMILILCISDFIYHIMILLFTWWPSSDIQKIVKPIIHTTMRFSIFWAACIAYLVYASLDPEKDFSVTFNTKTTFFLALLISVVLSTLCAIFQQIYFLVITMIVPLILSLSLITIFYLKSISFIKHICQATEKPNPVTIRNLYIYSIIHLIPVTPILIYYLLDLVSHDAMSPFKTYVSLPLGFAGLINTFAYFFQRRGSRRDSEGPKTEFSLETLEKPLAFYGSATDRST